VPPRRTISHSPLPGLGLAHGFDGDIHAAAVRQTADGADGVGFAFHHNQFIDAQRGRPVKLGPAPPDRDHAAAVQLGQLGEHQADGAQPDDGDGVAFPGNGLFEAADHAGQRLHQRRVAIPTCPGMTYVLRSTMRAGMRMYSA